MGAAEIELEVAVGRRSARGTGALASATRRSAAGESARGESAPATGAAWPLIRPRGVGEFGGCLPAIGGLDNAVLGALENDVDLIVGIGAATADPAADRGNHGHRHDRKIAFIGLAGDVVGAGVVLDKGDPAVAFRLGKFHGCDDRRLDRSGVESGRDPREPEREQGTGAEPPDAIGVRLRGTAALTDHGNSPRAALASATRWIPRVRAARRRLNWNFFCWVSTASFAWSRMPKSFVSTSSRLQ